MNKKQVKEAIAFELARLPKKYQTKAGKPNWDKILPAVIEGKIPQDGSKLRLDWLAFDWTTCSVAQAGDFGTHAAGISSHIGRFFHSTLVNAFLHSRLGNDEEATAYFKQALTTHNEIKAIASNWKPEFNAMEKQILGLTKKKKAKK